MPAQDIESVSRWLSNKDSRAILDEEVAYVKHTSDIVQLAPRSKSSLRKLLERSERFRLFRLWRTDPPDGCANVMMGDENVHYSSNERIEKFVAIIILSLGIIMLIAPLWVLEFVNGPINRLGIITMFIVLFIILLSFTTVAKPFESLTAAAA